MALHRSWSDRHWQHRAAPVGGIDTGSADPSHVARLVGHVRAPGQIQQNQGVAEWIGDHGKPADGDVHRFNDDPATAGAKDLDCVVCRLDKPVRFVEGVSHSGGGEVGVPARNVVVTSAGSKA